MYDRGECWDDFVARKFLSPRYGACGTYLVATFGCVLACVYRFELRVHHTVKLPEFYHLIFDLG